MTIRVLYKFLTGIDWNVDKFPEGVKWVYVWPVAFFLNNVLKWYFFFFNHEWCL
ncbi:hypothetical protein GF352_02080 [archaeon]|nr:hypothetical protein [archaeon]